MLNTFEAITERRSVKHFDSSFIIPEADILHIIEMARNAPSSFNIQHWRLVHVTDNSIRKQIREAAANQVQVTEASDLFLICVDIKAWDKDPARYWESIGSEKANFTIVPSIRKFYNADLQLQRDEAMRSVGMFAQNFMLAAKAMSYDTCPMIGFDMNRVAEIINLPDHHAIGLMIALGKALKPAKEKGGYISLNELIIKNKF